MGRDRRNTTSNSGSFNPYSSTNRNGGVDVDLYHAGLMNLGNSCYYNSILQSLTCTVPLVSLIQNPPTSSPTLSILSPASTSPLALLPLPSPVPVSSALLLLLERLELNPYASGNEKAKKTVNPRELLNVLAKRNEEYRDGLYQEDAHELLRCLIDCVLMEEVDLIKRLAPAPPAPATPIRRPRAARSSTLIPSSTSNLAPDAIARPTLHLSRPTMDVVPSLNRPEKEGQNAEVNGLGLALNGEDRFDGEGELVKTEEPEEDDEGLEGDDESSESSSSSSSSSSDSSDDESEEPVKVGEKMTPFVESVFGGKLRSFIVCSECQFVSHSSEDFLDFSLSLKEDPTGLRKRDRIRRTLQSGFFSRKADPTPISPPAPLSQLPLTPTSPPAIPLRNIISLSETEGSASGSQASFSGSESDDGKNGLKIPRSPSGGAGIMRRKSLDPGFLRRGKSGFWSSNAKEGGEKREKSVRSGTGSTSANISQASSRDPSRSQSPLGHLAPNSPPSRSSRPSSRSRSRHDLLPHPTPRIPAPTSEEVQYVKRILKNIPSSGAIPLSGNVVEGLRWSKPAVRRGSVGAMGAALVNGLTMGDSAKVKEREKDVGWVESDLYECLLSFTSVEVLDGENAFACRKCWKYLNPDLVFRRKVAKDLRKQERMNRHKLKKVGRVTEGEGEFLPLSADAMVQPPLTVAENPSVSLASFAAIKLEQVVTPSSSSITEEEGSTTTDGSHITDTSSLAPGINILPPTPAPARLTRENISTLAAPIRSSPVLPSAASRLSKTSTTSLSAAQSPTSTSTALSLPKALPAPPKEARHILRKAHKRYLISSPDLPPVLAIQFKRFQQTAKSSIFGTPFMNLKKRDDVLTFPMELDISPFLAPLGKPPSKSIHSSQPVQDNTSSPIKTPAAKYSLYSVVVHSGNLKMGHYVNYSLSDRYRLRGGSGNIVEGEAKGEGEKGEKTHHPRVWVYSSDHEVRTCSVDEVMNSKAYMLFYERMQETSPEVTASAPDDLKMVKSHI